LFAEVSCFETKKLFYVVNAPTTLKGTVSQISLYATPEGKGPNMSKTILYSPLVRRGEAFVLKYEYDCGVKTEAIRKGILSGL